MSGKPWMKFFPRDWRGDQALRAVSLMARGLWMEMLCIMHEASPRGHLLIGAKPVTDDVLARAIGARTEEVQAGLVELHNAGVFDRSRNGVILSRRMIADERKAKLCRTAKLEALEEKGIIARPKRAPSRAPSTQKPEARGKGEGSFGPSPLTEAILFLGPKEVREAFVAELGDAWCRTWLDRCAWQDVPERALIPPSKIAGQRLVREGRRILGKLGLTVLERAA